MSKDLYPYIKLKNICTVNQGLQIAISKRFRKHKVGRYFYITVQFLKEGFLGTFYVENPPPSSICTKEDILVVRTGNTGQVITGVEGCFHNNFFKVNIDKGKIYSKFLYYCLITSAKQKEMARRAGVTTIPDLNHFMFLDMEIPLTSILNQKKAARVLDTINAKIELNNKINKQLEQMAKLLYDYWFVQFDFPDAEGKPYKSSGGKMVYNAVLKRDIPEGWEVFQIDDYANIVDPHPSHRAPKEVKDGFPFAGIGDIDEFGNISISKARVINEDFVLKQEHDYKIQNNTLGYGRVGTVGKVVRLRKQKYRYALSPTMAIINPKDKKFSSFVYFNVKSEFFYKNVLKRSSGTTRPAIGIMELRKIPVVGSSISQNEIEKFETRIKPLMKKVEVLNQQNQELIKLRDWLLPMLMNGQVVVE